MYCTVQDLRSLKDIRTISTLHAGSLPRSGKRVISRLERVLNELKRIERREGELRRQKIIAGQKLAWIRRQEDTLGHLQEKMRASLIKIEREESALERKKQELGKKLDP